MSTNICYPFILNPTGGSFYSTKLLINQINDEFNCQLVFGVAASAAQNAREEGISTTVLNLSDATHDRLLERNNLLSEVLLGARLVPYIRRCRRYLRSESIDIVHVNDGLAAIIWGVSARLAGIPVIWHVRSQRSNAWDPIRLRLANRIILVAEANKVRFGWEGIPDKRASVVHNGVDTTEFSPGRSSALHSELGIPEGSRIVGFVGNLVARKRPMLFVKSALQVLTERKDVHFVVVGEDKDEFSAMITEMARDHSDDSNIHLLGFRSDISSIMQALDLLVITSTSDGEAFPRVPLEAMACGTPVVTTDTAGVSEAVVNKKTGIVLDTNSSPSRIGREILRLLRNGERLDRLGLNAISHAEEMFSAEEYANNIEQVYRQI